MSQVLRLFLKLTLSEREFTFDLSRWTFDLSLIPMTNQIHACFSDSCLTPPSLKSFQVNYGRGRPHLPAAATASMFALSSGD